MTWTATLTPRIYQLKVLLSGTRPYIWRRVLVPEDMTLADLHEVVQKAMGWKNAHEHQFVSERYGQFGPPDAEPSLGPRHGESQVRLQDVLAEPKDRMLYDYDFGDSWQHEVILERILPIKSGMLYPRVVGGKRACPPEDCGGTPGFEDLLVALADPTHPKHEELTLWIGGPFDPEAFDVDKANDRLQGDKLAV